MTISAARLIANRRNSLKGKGPASEAGTQAAKFNAWKHGFRAGPDAVAPDEAEALDARLAQLSDALPDLDGTRRWLAEQLALVTVRLDRCQAHIRSQARFEAGRVASCWDLDRDADAAALGARLHREPDLVVSRLRRSAAGVDWLLCRWQSLADCLDAVGSWDDAQRQLCLDLMRTPAEFLPSERALLESLPLDELRELAREHVASLEGLREPASAIDAVERDLAEAGLPTIEGPELRRLRRYEADLWRRLRSLEASLFGPLVPATTPLPDADASLPSPSSTAPPPPAEPPAPRPDRTIPRNPPPPSPMPPAAQDDPRPPSATIPVRLSPDRPPAPMNRRERRALKKKRSRAASQ